jgi:hypothetical protein
MKKIFTQIFIFVLIGSATYSQNIGNGSFENWTSYNGTSLFGVPFSGEYPTGWQTTDSIYQYGTAPRSALREGVNKCDTLYSIKLITQSALGNIGPGVATNGTLAGTSVSGGKPDTARSAQFSGCYLYSPVNTDTGMISAYLFKWDTALAKRDTIAFAKMSMTTANTSMTSFMLNFSYVDWSREPDTLLITLQSSPGLNGSSQVGSTLYIDSLRLSGYVGISKNAYIREIKIFPQPAQNELNIDITLNHEIEMTYQLADITGRRVLNGMIHPGKQKIDINSLSRGSYFISLYSREGAILYSSKFIVSK